MKKSKIKFIIKKSLDNFYKNGLTATASRFRKEIFDGLDRAYLKESNHQATGINKK